VQEARSTNAYNANKAAIITAFTSRGCEDAGPVNAQSPLKAYIESGIICPDQSVVIIPKGVK
jgi:hypothetical protein